MCLEFSVSKFSLDVLKFKIGITTHERVRSSIFLSISFISLSIYFITHFVNKPNETTNNNQEIEIKTKKKTKIRGKCEQTLFSRSISSVSVVSSVETSNLFVLVLNFFRSRKLGNMRSVSESFQHQKKKNLYVCVSC